MEVKSLHGVQKACFRDMVKGSLNIKEEDEKYFLIVIGLADVMEEAEDSVDCSTVFSSSHLFIMKEVRLFC